MTEQEAIKELEWAKNRLIQFSHMDNNRMNAFDMAIKALEKQIAKQPIDKIAYDECPSCGEIDIGRYRYCPVCGQKLDLE